MPKLMNEKVVDNSLNKYIDMIKVSRFNCDILDKKSFIVENLRFCSDVFDVTQEIKDDKLEISIGNNFRFVFDFLIYVKYLEEKGQKFIPYEFDNKMVMDKDSGTSGDLGGYFNRTKMRSRAFEDLLKLNDFEIFFNEYLLCRVNFCKEMMQSDDYIKLNSKEIFLNLPKEAVAVHEGELILDTICFLRPMIEPHFGCNALHYVLSYLTCQDVGKNGEMQKFEAKQQIDAVVNNKITKTVVDCTRQEALLSGGNLVGLSDSIRVINRKDIANSSGECLNVYDAKKVYVDIEFSNGLKLTKNDLVLLSYDKNEVVGFKVVDKKDYIEIRELLEPLEKGNSEDLDYADERNKSIKIDNLQKESEKLLKEYNKLLKEKEALEKSLKKKELSVNKTSCAKKTKEITNEK